MIFQSTPVGSTQTGTEVIVSPSRENRERHPTATKVKSWLPPSLFLSNFSDSFVMQRKEAARAAMGWCGSVYQYVCGQELTYCLQLTGVVKNGSGGVEKGAGGVVGVEGQQHQILLPWTPSQRVEDDAPRPPPVRHHVCSDTTSPLPQLQCYYQGTWPLYKNWSKL